MSFVSQHKGVVVWSVLLHVAVVAALTIGFRLPARERVAVAAAPIQGMIVDQNVLERETERREQVVRQERQRVQREQRREREAAEAAQQAVTDAARREQERVAAEQAARERTAAQERERAEAAKRQQEQQAREQRERAAREQQERDEAAKREAAAAAARREQQRAEAELQAALAAEDDRRQAEQAGLLDQYIRLIENQIERNWSAPPTARVGLECVVNVVQIPSGDVIDVRVSSCNGDDAVIRSIEAAVRRASPLPKPPQASLFERNLIVTFRPDL